MTDRAEPGDGAPKAEHDQAPHGVTLLEHAEISAALAEGELPQAAVLRGPRAHGAAVERIDELLDGAPQG